MGERKSYTVAPDPRFQDVDATAWCFTSFVNYHRCLKLIGTNPNCDKLKKIYRSICPNGWVARWEDQLKAGTFPLDLPPDKCKK